ncbi:MAG TPA: class II fructose-bisphosphatase [Methylomirabilota bacterium]|jgi:fructose-1,6-bisphosphatase II|nr:class II fructose-bisphosphatase [Methylomirabilota bacterium]
MDKNLALEVVRITEAAALAAAQWLGKGDEAAADFAAAEAMHKLFHNIEFKGEIVIGEGEPDATDMLYLGEIVGKEDGPEFEVALDALEGPVACASGAPNAISVIAIAEHGGFLRCPPHVHMEKIAVGPVGKGVIDLDKPLEENLRALADFKAMKVEHLTVVVLDRPRHEELVNKLRQLGARVKLISDGDLSAALTTAREDTGIDLLLGTGGAAQGVIAAAALRCLGGEIQGRFRPRNQEEAGQLRRLGITDFQRKYTAEEMARGNVVFAATGVTTGDYLRGVRLHKGGAVTNSVVMRSKTRTIRFLETFHHFEDRPEYD